MSVLNVKELQIDLEEAKESVAFSDTDSSMQRAEQWVDLLSRIDAYVKSLVWFAKSSYKRELRVFLMSGCSYKDTAEQCGVTVTSLRKVVLQASLVLDRRLDAVLKALRQGNIHAVEQEFRRATDGDDDSFLNVVRQQYKPVVHGGVDLKTCSHELGFLQSLCNLEDRRLSLDREKLEHLQYILLANDVRYAVIASRLYECLEGKSGVAETLERISEYVRSRRPIWMGEE